MWFRIQELGKSTQSGRIVFLLNTKYFVVNTASLSVRCLRCCAEILVFSLKYFHTCASSFLPRSPVVNPLSYDFPLRGYMTWREKFLDLPKSLNELVRNLGFNPDLLSPHTESFN